MPSNSMSNNEVHQCRFEVQEFYRYHDVIDAEIPDGTFQEYFQANAICAVGTWLSTANTSGLVLLVDKALGYNI